MAIGIYSHPESMTAAQYDETSRCHEAAGAGRPKVASITAASAPAAPSWSSTFGSSQESFDEFGKTLIPILQEVGLNSGEPVIEPIRNMTG